MPFRLRHLQHNFELARGEFVIGRSAECQLALDDPLVSRKHAVLIVSDDSIIIKDLASRNGVMVNGIRIQMPTALTDGDRIVIGGQELTLLASRASEEPALGTRRKIAGIQTMSVLPAIHERVDEARETSKRVEALGMLSTLADKAFALGRPDEAERILSTVLHDLLRAAREGRFIASATLERAALYAVRLAAAGPKASWVDFVFALYSVARRPCPAAVVDELHLAIRKAPGIDLAALRAYLEVLQEESLGYGPAERFLVQRIAGLERLASVR